MKQLENYHRIEGRLTEKLHVYQPNPQFVVRLRTRLVNDPGIEVESRKARSRILLATTGVLAIAAILLWLIFYISSFFKNEESD